MRIAPSIQSALDEAVAKEVFPGAVLAFRRGDEAPCIAVSGHLSSEAGDGPVAPCTSYDLASLTKPLATVTAIALLVQAGRCRLDDPLQRFLPELQDAPLGFASLQDVLTHSSGLPGWRGLYERLSPNARLPATPEARAEAALQALGMIKAEAPVYPRGDRSLYSDLGFILLGIFIERLYGMSLDRIVRQQITEPLDATLLSYLPLDRMDQRRIAPSEFDVWRGRVLRGEVHDENAAALGGVAGHAGLFGAAESVLAVTGEWLRAWRGKSSILLPEVARVFTTRQQVPGSSWALGWDTPSTPSTSGRYFSTQSFGHLGYTGTSMWVDPIRELEVVLLSNRVYPTRKNEAIKYFRPAIHDLICEEVEGGV